MAIICWFDCADSGAVDAEGGERRTLPVAWRLLGLGIKTETGQCDQAQGDISAITTVVSYALHIHLAQFFCALLWPCEASSRNAPAIATFFMKLLS